MRLPQKPPQAGWYKYCRRLGPIRSHPPFFYALLFYHGVSFAGLMRSSCITKCELFTCTVRPRDHAKPLKLVLPRDRSDDGQNDSAPPFSVKPVSPPLQTRAPDCHTAALVRAGPLGKTSAPSHRSGAPDDPGTSVSANEPRFGCHSGSPRRARGIAVLDAGRACLGVAGCRERPQRLQRPAGPGVLSFRACVPSRAGTGPRRVRCFAGVCGRHGRPHRHFPRAAGPGAGA